MEQIKVLQITQSLGGGVQKYILQICEHLNPNQFHITGCCSRESKESKENGDIPFSAAFLQMGVPYFVVPMQRSLNPWKDFLSFLKIYQKIKQEGFDLVHAHSSKAGVLARIAARMAGVPVVIYSPHAFFFDGPGPLFKKFPYILFEKIAGFFCDLIIADSPSEKKLALKFRICQKEKIAVIPPSLKLQVYKPEVTGEERRKHFKEIGVSLGNMLVTMIGRLAPQKDPFSFIYSAALLKKNIPDVCFLLVGDGPLMGRCLQLIQELELDGRMKILGWRRDYKMLLRISNVIVNASLWEGLPFILLEAMALEKPVISTRVTGVVDVIHDGENGFLVPPRSPQLLADKIKWVLNRPEVAAQVGRAARKTVESDYSLEKAIFAIENLYTKLYTDKKERVKKGNA